MFSPSRIPTDLPPELPEAVTQALSDYAAACDLYARSTNVDGIGDRDLATARAADEQLILEALAEGRDLETVGRPNEASFLARREAYRKAHSLTAQQAAETAHRVAAVLGEHADEIVAAFAEQARAASEAYLAAIAALATARADVERHSSRLSWATRIDGRRVPSVAPDGHPTELRVRASNAYGTDTLVELLEADADELTGKQLRERQQRRDEAARQAEAERRNAERIKAVTAASIARRKARALA